MNKEYKEGDLKVWWIPQIPMKPFEVDILDKKIGLLILNVLAAYDIFQFEKNIKPDYASVGGLVIYKKNSETEEMEWVEWFDEITGDDIWEKGY